MFLIFFPIFIIIIIIKKTITIEEKLNEEMAQLQRKVIEEQLQKEECNNTIVYMKQINKELENKINTLENENFILKKGIDQVNDKNNKNDFLLKKCESMENEIKYKESIILYLENLLKSNKSNV